MDAKTWRDGYEAGKRDAIGRCLIEKTYDHPGWRRTHNFAIDKCILAIRALDVRHALERAEANEEQVAPNTGAVCSLRTNFTVLEPEDRPMRVSGGAR